MNNFKIVIAGVVTFLGILGGVWAMEEHYVPRDYYLLSMDQVQMQMKSFQKTNLIQRAQDQVFYWIRLESQLKVELSKDPNNQYLIRELNEACLQKRNAQQRLNDLQK